MNSSMVRLLNSLRPIRVLRLIRPGEVLGFDFYDKGDTNTVSLDAETGLEVSALGATTTLTAADGDFTVSQSDIL